MRKPDAFTEMQLVLLENRQGKMIYQVAVLRLPASHKVLHACGTRLCLMRIRDIELHKDGVSRWQVYSTYEGTGHGGFRDENLLAQYQ
ncbi:hypothetical protein NXS19_010072 [Fusarium pseudograminearum]|nr:hypothetical protein NXS19_010072 [Fusarium pseudograminearum]